MSITAETAPSTEASAPGSVGTMALFGTGLAFVLALIRSGSVTEADLGFSIWILLACVLSIWVLLARSRRILVARPELLTPIGIVLPLEVLRQWVIAAPALQRPMAEASLSLWSLQVSISLGSISAAVLWTSYAAWQTDLLRRALTRLEPLDLHPWPPIQRHFWRAFGVLFVGLGGLQLLGIPLMIAGANRILDFPPFAFLVVLTSLFWSAATLPMLPWLLMSPQRFNLGVASAFRLRWWRYSMALRLAALQLALMGVVTYYSSSGGGRSSLSASVHSHWVGGYECQTSWYYDHQSWLRHPNSPFVVTLLMSVFLVLAVAVKIAVIQMLVVKPEAIAGPKLDPALVETEYYSRT